MKWIGIIFLASTIWLNGESYGINDEHFESQEACWHYFDNHPSFKLIKEYKHNFYDTHSRVKFYQIKQVGKAWVTCKLENEPRNIK